LKEKPALIVSGVIGATAATAATDPAFAATTNTANSRTDGYKVQHTDREWSYILSGQQYNVLRQGGTERQKSSILNTFTSKDHVGTYVCAGCNTPLFTSESKFSSGTGWPSFAYSYNNNNSKESDGGESESEGEGEGGGVEIEQLDPIRSALNGREVRCNTCGGHLGDVFNDGYIYIGTPAFQSGQRYCINGSALIFIPTSTATTAATTTTNTKNGAVVDDDGLVVKEGEDTTATTTTTTSIYGDTPPPNKTIRYEQSIYRN
jgi:peptide-methionine (R)-S-oxide reductase